MSCAFPGYQLNVQLQQAASNVPHVSMWFLKLKLKLLLLKFIMTCAFIRVV